MPLTPPTGPYAVSTLELEIPAWRAGSGWGGSGSGSASSSSSSSASASASQDGSGQSEQRAGAPPRTFAPQFKIATKQVFKLETVLVTLFYPTGMHAGSAQGSANGGGRKNVSGVGWLNSPRLKTVEGLLKYAGISKYFAFPAIVPAYNVLLAKLPLATNAPLASYAPDLPSDPQEIRSRYPSPTPAPAPSDVPPVQVSDDREKRFPVAVFSHGLGGTRTTYSQYLAALASNGMVVAAVEHRDGSGPSTTIHHPRSASGKAREETLVYFRHEELDKDATGQEVGDIWSMRRAQLELRQAEMLEALSVLQRIDAGEGAAVSAESTRGGEESRKNVGWEEWKGRLDIDRPWALGHSYGGATCIEVIRASDSPFSHALTLDPWCEPIKGVDDGGLEIKRPLFVINSDKFTVWRGHFDGLKKLVQQARQKSGHGWLLTMTGTSHTDFSDFPWLMPRMFASKVEPNAALQVFAEASVKQFAALRRSASSSVGRKDKDGQADGDDDGHGDGAERDAEEEVLETLHLPVRPEKEGELARKDLGPPGELIRHDVSPAQARL